MFGNNANSQWKLFDLVWQLGQQLPGNFPKWWKDGAKHPAAQRFGQLCCRYSSCWWDTMAYFPVINFHLLLGPKSRDACWDPYIICTHGATEDKINWELTYTISHRRVPQWLSSSNGNYNLSRNCFWQERKKEIVCSTDGSKITKSITCMLTSLNIWLMESLNWYYIRDM